MGRRYLYRWPKDQVLFGLSSVELSSQLLCARSSVLCTTRRYGLLGLRPSSPYEVRISYPSTVRTPKRSLQNTFNARFAVPPSSGRPPEGACCMKLHCSWRRMGRCSWLEIQTYLGGLLGHISTLPLSCTEPSEGGASSGSVGYLWWCGPKTSPS